MKKFVLFLLVSFLVISSVHSQSGWVQQTSGVGFNLNSVYFVDANTGYIAADSNSSPRVLKTTNGGLNWTRQTIPITGPSLRTIFFLDANTGYAGGADAPTA